MLLEEYDSWRFKLQIAQFKKAMSKVLNDISKEDLDEDMIKDFQSKLVFIDKNILATSVSDPVQKKKKAYRVI